jgi:two-component system cell cycle response regulator PopA
MPTVPNTTDSFPQSLRKPRIQTILIATDQPEQIEDLIIQLRNRDFNVQLSYFDGAKLSAMPVSPPTAIICRFSDNSGKASTIAEILKQHYAPVSLPIIGIIGTALTSQDTAFDSIIIQPAHASQIANRVNSLIRLGAMEQEITLRIETLEQDFAQAVHVEDDGEHPPFRILFIGRPSPSFMIVVNALQEKNVEVVAAFTSFSAFDYLHEASFDAVVMNALEQPEPSLSISETMRRNSRLYNVPILFIVDGDHFDYADKAYESGASDIINVRNSVDETSGRVLELANYHRLHGELKHEFVKLGEKGGICQQSKCYTKAFMDKHSERVLANAKKQNVPLSFLALELTPECSQAVDPSFMNDAVARIGGILKNLVRMQDTVSYYAPYSFLLMFPNTTEYETQTILKRVKALMDCTAYESGVPNAALTMAMNSAIIEAEKGESAKEAIDRVITHLSYQGSMPDYGFEDAQSA